MNPEDIQEFSSKQPFEPFVIHLTDGRSFEVKHPDAIALGRRRAVVSNPGGEGGEFIHFAYRHVISIDVLETST